MNFFPTAIPEVILIEPRIFADERGFFLETYRQQQFESAGIIASFVQDNHSGSYRGALRGLHYQIQQPQGKLVRAVAGEIYDVAVDIRRSSPTFGQWVGLVLSADNKRQLWVPPGFAHGFLAREDSLVLYGLTQAWDVRLDRAIRWDSPDLSIDWPLDGAVPIVSVRDRDAPAFGEAEVFDEDGSDGPPAGAR